MQGLNESPSVYDTLPSLVWARTSLVCFLFVFVCVCVSYLSSPSPFPTFLPPPRAMGDLSIVLNMHV